MTMKTKLHVVNGAFYTEEHFLRFVQTQYAAAQADIHLLKFALVKAAMPLEAIILSGRINDFCPEVKVAIEEAVSAIREAIVETSRPKP